MSTNERTKKIKQSINKEICLDSLSDGDISEIENRCCENILGFKKVPLGVSDRKIKINDKEFWIPICTTEGALVASMCRGIKILNLSGLEGIVENLGITRSFALKFSSFQKSKNFLIWLKNNEESLKKVGESTSRFLKVKSVASKHVFGNEVYVKVTAFTGNAMGMNMITKACVAISKEICREWQNCKLVCISANICTDKKWSVENYANGRGRRVSLSVILKKEDVNKILKVSVSELYKTYHTKIMVGGAIVLGGFNTQAANIVAGVFLALGQDLGHVIESSNCIVSMEITESGDLMVNSYMPSIVVGVIGGGTHLGVTKEFLKQFEIEKSDCIFTDENDVFYAPSYLALAVSGAVLAAEISGLAALCNNTLMDAHLALNRKN